VDTRLETDSRPLTALPRGAGASEVPRTGACNRMTKVTAYPKPVLPKRI